MKECSFLLLDEPLPEHGFFESNVPSKELDALGTSLIPINTKVKEAGLISPEVLDDRGDIDMFMFGVLDHRSSKDHTMLLVKREYDFSRDENGQIIPPDWGEPEEDVAGWHTLRIYFQGAISNFASFTINHIADFKDGGGCYDDAGVFRYTQSIS